jgi:hypothetical protein
LSLRSSARYADLGEGLAGVDVTELTIAALIARLED